MRLAAGGAQAALPDRRPSAARLPGAGGGSGAAPDGPPSGVGSGGWASRPPLRAPRGIGAAAPRCRSHPTHTDTTRWGEETYSNFYFLWKEETSSPFTSQCFDPSSSRKHSTPQSEGARWLGAIPPPSSSTCVHVVRANGELKQRALA